jgi:hypothetical protein
MNYREYINHLLNEVHFKDVTSEGFQKFYDKYKRFKTDKSLYVQFTGKDNIDDKTSVQTPSHNDPMGIYGYPLNYIINNPADIWYGTRSKYIRVLKLKDNDKTLVLSDLSDYFFRNMLLSKLKDLTNNYVDEEIVKKFLRSNLHKGYTINTGKIFMFYVQHKIPNDFSWKKSEWRDLTKVSSKEQNIILQKLGYNNIIDNTSSEKTASINNREPQQILFLNRKDLEIIDVFQNYPSSEQQGVSITRNTEDYFKKICSLIFQSIGDQIVSGYTQSGLDGKLFFSKNKRRILINSMKDTDQTFIGWKKHKETKTGTPEIIKIQLITEYGDIYDAIYRDDKLEDAINNIKEKFLTTSKTDNPDNSKLFSKQEWDKKIKDDDRKAYEKYRSQEDEKIIINTFREVKQYEENKSQPSFELASVLKTKNDYMSLYHVLNWMQRSSNLKECISQLEHYKQEVFATKDEIVIKHILDFVRWVESYEAKGVKFERLDNLYWIRRNISEFESKGK